MEAGLDSMSAADLHSGVQQTVGVELPAALMADSTIRRMQAVSGFASERLEVPPADVRCAQPHRLRAGVSSPEWRVPAAREQHEEVLPARGGELRGRVSETDRPPTGPPVAGPTTLVSVLQVLKQAVAPCRLAERVEGSPRTFSAHAPTHGVDTSPTRRIRRLQLRSRPWMAALGRRLAAPLAPRADRPTEPWLSAAFATNSRSVVVPVDVAPQKSDRAPLAGRPFRHYA